MYEQVQCARVQGRGQAAMYLFSFRVAFTTCITCNNLAKLQQSNFPTQQLNKAVQGNLPYFPQSNVGIFVACQKKFKFPSVFCKLLFGCLLWQIQILLTWPPEAPSQGRTLMDPAADDLQSPWITNIYQRCLFCRLLKVSFQTSGKNINALIFIVQTTLYSSEFDAITKFIDKENWNDKSFHFSYKLQHSFLRVVSKPLRADPFMIPTKSQWWGQLTTSIVVRLEPSNCHMAYIKPPGRVEWPPPYNVLSFYAMICEDIYNQADNQILLRKNNLLHSIMADNNTDFYK